jgi:hypothetical protein
MLICIAMQRVISHQNNRAALQYAPAAAVAADVHTVSGDKIQLLPGLGARNCH